MIPARLHWMALIVGNISLLGAPPAFHYAPPPVVGVERPVPDDPDGVDFRDGLRQASEPGVYDIGDPTDEEQLYLELINRSRADPAAEGRRLAALNDPPTQGAYAFFGVDLERMEQELARFPPSQPLAFETRLIAAARGHSIWMRTVGIQSHNQFVPTTGQVLNTTRDRMDASGYPWQRFGESVFAYAESAENGHAGFVVDWGPGPGGVQEPPGHRISNFQPEYRAVGVGVVEGNGPNGTGPEFVTIKFAAPRNPVPLITGVIHYDFNGNQFYDPGEGVGDVVVTLSGAATRAMSAASGGFALPAANGSHEVVFTWEGMPLGTASATVSGGENALLNLTLPYPAPQLSGPGNPALNQSQPYQYTLVPGATGYEWRTLTRGELPVFNAQSGLAGLVTALNGTPFPLVPANGGTVYHLTHAGTTDDQSLEVDAWVQPSATGAVRFQHRMGIAGDGQVAQLQVREETGSWQTLWSLRGMGPPGDAQFTETAVSLADFSGRVLRVRFVFASGPGTLYPQPNAEVGIQLDNISFPGADAVVSGPIRTLEPGAPVSFAPESLEPVELVVRPVRTRGPWPWGPSLRVTPVVAPPQAPIITGIASEAGGAIRIEFNLAGTPASTPVLQRGLAIGGPYAPVPATLQADGPGRYRFQHVPDTLEGFLRVVLP